MADLDRDSISSRISPNCPPATQRILTTSWAHDVPQLKPLLDEPGKASLQDPVTGETPLHAAIRSCGTPSEDDSESDLEAARETVRELLMWGGIWNDVDDRDETPGCVAWRLGRRDLYEMCVAAGVRAEMLFGLMDGYEALESGGEEEDDDEGEVIDLDVVEDGEEAPQLVNVEENGEGDGENGMTEEVQADDAQDVEESEPRFVAPNSTGAVDDVKSEEYLRSNLTYSDGKLVDASGNGVMMAWETEIMRESVNTLLRLGESGEESGGSGKRILNIGFGMGIIDSMFADTKPARHHIIEAHPDVLARVSQPDSKFGSTWEASAPEPGAYKIHAGKWQEVCQTLLEQGNVYDAIYFDTFGEDYSELRKFFTEFIPGLLDEKGIFGFFNGLGADRRICYDVYTQVVEMHLSEAGLDVDWKVIDVDMKDLSAEGKGEWEGVKRRYWTLDKYRLPICTFLG